MQQQYELMLLTSSDLDDAARGAILERVQKTVSSGGGTWVKLDDIGRRKLAYEIQKKPDAHYSLAQFDSEPAVLDEIVRIMRITDGVLRVMGVNRPTPMPEGVTVEMGTGDEEPERERERGGRGRGGGGRGRDRR